MIKGRTLTFYGGIIFLGVIYLEEEPVKASQKGVTRPKKLLRDPIMCPYNLAKFQIDTTHLTPSKMLWRS
jgi:hypothetical protein